MAVMAFLAIKLPETIWRITEIKLELLCQVAPAIFLGINIKSLKTKPVIVGFLVGTVIAVAMITASITLGFPGKPLGIHAGIWGLVANLIVIYVMNKKEN